MMGSGKSAVKKNERNWPVKKSLRVVKDKAARRTEREQREGN